ncbi:MAG: metallophosphoesterase family protein, partial [SAR324 cluster bacterium]|nr:metallophosphoesterase family protein [SAR324 cluster bacterium]
FDICFLGHTHRRMKYRLQNKLIVNPGSIGQPRDKLKGKASWVEFDEKKKYQERVAGRMVAQSHSLYGSDHALQR